MIDISKLKIRNMANFDNAEHRLIEKYQRLIDQRFLKIGATSRFLRPAVGADNGLTIIPDPMYEGELRQIVEDIDSIDAELIRCERKFLDYEAACAGDSTDRIAHQILILKEKIERTKKELESNTNRESGADAPGRQRLAIERQGLEEQLARLEKEHQEAQGRHRKLYTILTS